MFRIVGNLHGAGNVLHALGIQALQTERMQDAARFLEECYAIRKSIDNKLGQAQALSSLGRLAMNDNPEAAKIYLQQSIDLSEQIGDHRVAAGTTSLLGKLLHDLGDDEGAIRLLIRSLQICRLHRYRRDEASNLQYLGVFSRDAQQWETARDYYLESLEILQEIGDQRAIVHSYYGLGMVLMHIPSMDGSTIRESSTYFNQGLELCRQIQDRRDEGISLFGMATLHEHLGEQDQAEMCYMQALALLKRVNDKHYEALTKEHLGLLWLAQPSPDRYDDGYRFLQDAQTAFYELKEFTAADRLQRRLAMR